MANVGSHKPSGNEYFDKINASLVAWLVFLTFGGGILTFYYAKIKYLPEVEWSSSLIFLALATFVGGAFALLLGLSLFIPGYIWSEFLLFDDKLKNVFCYHSQTDEICVRTLAKYIGLPFGSVLLLNHLTLLFFPCWMNCTSFRGTQLLVAYAMVSVVLLVLISVVMRRVFGDLHFFSHIGPGFWKRLFWRNTSPVTSPPIGSTADEKRRVFKYVVWFGLSILLSQISMVLIHLMSNRPTGYPFLVTTAFCAAGVLVSNHVVAVHYRRSRLHAILTAMVIALLMLFIADRNESLSSQVVAFFGAGEKSPKVDFVLNEEGSKAIGESLAFTCTKVNSTNPANVTSDANTLPRKVCQVRVLSRLGNEFYLDYDGRKFTLPKSYVAYRIISENQPVVTNHCCCILESAHNLIECPESDNQQTTK
jgi:hypothetical protein